MKFRNLFYDSSINLKSISKGRLIIAILFGIASALIIYSFFFILVETFRVMDSGFDGLPQIISEKDRTYYNTFFAALSLIFGNSISINFLFSKPQKVTHRFNSKRKRLLNDNIFLSFNFSYWFLKLGLSFGIFAMCCIQFELMPYFKQFSFLLIAVLYLESIKNFGFFFRNKERLKFISLHVLLLTILTFGLREINVVNYKAINAELLRNDPIIDLPESTYYNNQRNYRDLNIFFKMDVDSTGKAYVYYQKNKLEIEEVRFTFLSHYREELISHYVIHLDANKNCSIFDIKRFEKAILESNRYKILYTIKRSNSSEIMFEPVGIKKFITPQVLKLKDRIVMPPPPPIPFENWVDETISDTLRIEVESSVLVNNLVVEKPRLKQIFKEKYKVSTLFLYQYSPNTTYQDYINVLEAHSEALDEIRAEHQTVFDTGNYPSNAYREEQSELRFKFPLKIGEQLD